MANSEQGRRGRGRIAAWTGAGLVVLVAAGYVGVAAKVTQEIPAGSHVGGVAVGGKSLAAAKSAINTKASSVGRNVTVVASGHTISFDAKTAGLSVDTTGAVDDLTGFSLNPSVVWDHLSGNSIDRKLPAKVDIAKLQQALRARSGVFKGAPVNGTVSFTDGKVTVTRSKPGTGIDVARTAKAIAAGWPSSTTYTATVGQVEAEITDAEIDNYVTTFAAPAMSAPVIVKVGDKTAPITPTALSGVLSTTVKDGKLTPVVDEKALAEVLANRSSVLVTPAENASYDGAGNVVQAKDGTQLDATGASAALLQALTSPGRTMTLKTTPIKAKIQAADLHTLGSGLVSEFSTPLPGGASNLARTKNIQVAMSRINGTVIAPGEQFSLLAALTPITKANGYVDAPVLVDGVDELGTGGGISQVSTTLYNATFFAGLQEDKHTSHAYWIPRYPMGREATLWVPTIDNKFTNDSGHPIRIEAGAGPAGTTAWVKIYGTKVFDVQSSTSAKFNVKPGKTRTVTKAGCIQQPEQDGFDVTVTRVVTQGGVVVKNERLTTHYIPADRIICKSP
ncbi:VanW family protein [Calidifontibacter terrae]